MPDLLLEHMATVMEWALVWVVGSVLVALLIGRLIRTGQGPRDDD